MTSVESIWIAAIKINNCVNFKGEVRQFDHYYRIYGSNNQPIKYCKFQQLDLLCKTLGQEIEVVQQYDKLDS